jgi:hypothetical protein
MDLGLLADPPLPGAREQRLAAVVARLSVAGTGPSLSVAIEDFHWATGQMEALIRMRVPVDASTKDELDRLEYAGGLLQRQREFAVRYPQAIKIPAVFYPHEDVDVQAQDQSRTTESARAIPWQFLLVRTPLDPHAATASGRNWLPPGFLWELHDITAPKQGRPRIQVRKQVKLMESYPLEPGKNAHDVDVLKDLFSQLDSPDYFPEGLLYWYSPISDTYDSVTMHARIPFGTWLQWIGMGIAVLGSLVFMPFSTPMLASAAVGTGVAVVGRTIRLDEQRSHGVLKESDVRQYYWDLAMDLVSALTMGFGRVAATARGVATAGRVSTAARAYFLLKRAELGTELINVGVITEEFISHAEAIKNSAMSPEQKHDAYVGLTKMAFVTGALSAVTVRAGIKQLHDPLPDLRLGRTKGGHLLGDVEQLTEDAASLTGKPGGRVTKVHSERIRTRSGTPHTLTLLSDGRIIRCSPRPCSEFVGDLLARIQKLQERAISDTAYFAAMDGLLVRARQLADEAARVALITGVPARSARRTLMRSGKDLERDVEALQQRISRETVAANRTGREEALLKYGTKALLHGPHYNWELSKRGLRLKRRSTAFPWKSFEPSTGEFKVSKPLFVPADEEALREIRRLHSTKDFPVRAVVKTRAEFEQVRPRTADPKEWVLIRIDDENLTDFYDDGLVPGVIWEYPDGSRAWRTPENTIKTESRVRAPIGRKGFEQSTPPATVKGGGVDLSATGVRHQRSHPAGSITGFEIHAHIPFAPEFVNQNLQAQGIEMYIKELHAAHPKLGLWVVTEHAVFPRTRRQAWIDYTILATGDGPRRKLLRARITTDYTDPARPATVEIDILTSLPTDLERLQDIDMPAARQALANRIRRTKRRRNR